MTFHPSNSFGIIQKTQGHSPEDEAYMAEALAQARIAEEAGEVPIGAVLVLEDKGIIARAHNRPLGTNDPTAHAEILAIREAGLVKRNYRLNDCTLYVTIEPCIMCAGALLQARVRRLVFGAPDPKYGAVQSLYRILTDERLNHRMEVTSGVLEQECLELLTAFFQRKRDQKRRGTEVAVTGSTRNRLVP
jgi:tRNA(adenine34) deaminase